MSDADEVEREAREWCACGERIEHRRDHPGECCDCFDLGCGMPLELVNAERIAAGKPPLAARHVRGPV